MEETMQETIIEGRAIPRGRTESEYRALEEDSSSSVKTFAEDRLKYYKRYIKGEWIDEEDGIAVIIGKLVDVKLLGEEGEIEEKFHISSVLNPPTGLMGQFVESLFTHTMACVNSEGEVTREFKDLMTDAYNSVKYDRDGATVAFKKQSLEKTIEVFLSTEAHLYYQEIRKVRPGGMTVITASINDGADRIVEKLKTSTTTKDIFSHEAEIAVYNQLKINGFEIDGLPLKGMIDRTHVDHLTKIIQPFDLKCTWDVEGFYENYYLKRKAFYQAYIYWKALDSRIFDLGFDYSKYTIMPTAFIVADSSNFLTPLIYTLSLEDMRESYEGFENKGRTYVGLKDVISELKWAKDNNIWDISKTNSDNSGMVEIASKRK